MMTHAKARRGWGPARLLCAALLCLVLIPLAPGAAADIGLATLFPTERQSRTLLVINKVLERSHYRGLRLGDELAEAVLGNYLEELDPGRLFFLQRDLDRFMRTANRLDDEIGKGKLDSAFDVFRVYRVRVDARVDYALSLLNGPFDFDADEAYLADRRQAPWAKSEAELDETWRKRVKNDYLLLKLANKDDAEIRDQLRKRYEGIARRIRQLSADDVFDVFANAYTRALEPHTGYLSPSAAESFDIGMRLSLQGIGAVLQADNELTVIRRTVPGGPARQSGKIAAGDRVVGVAQGLDGAMEDVIGWPLQEVVDRIRGPQGTAVRLLILPKAASAGGRLREVALVRREIALDDMAAKAFVIAAPTVPPPLRIGVITLPTFYRDFHAEAEGQDDFRSTTRDVRRLIETLKTQGIDGLVIDLRGNGGGSLSEATSLTGLFVDQQPVVQVKDASGKVELEINPDTDVTYTGPLAVLVDRDSASASEIFTAAIQDYGRGVVIGEPTFGKGTVQTLVDLDRYALGKDANLGRLRMTTAEFFRLSGSSTQLKGVEPDIQFDFGSDGEQQGERALANPLPWSRIEPAPHSGYRRPGLDEVRRRSQERTTADLGFELLSTQAQVRREIEAQTEVSLRASERRAESERRDRTLTEAKARYLRARGVEPLDEEADEIDEEAMEREQDLIDRIQTEEAARILADAIRIS
ncbi:MAG: carboxy terminal-processing peptidase [Chromatiaceae bacterium]|nr:carboxy terminal-processing peptidase [Chromatiaceae bacterium]